MAVKKDKPVPAKIDEVLLAPNTTAWEVCAPVGLGLLRATITELEREDDARFACILELLLDCLRDGGISEERRIALIASVRSLEGANEECVALLIQLLTLPAESEDHSRVLVLRNYLEHAQRAFTTFRDKCRDCEAGWLKTYVWKDLIATSETVAGHIETALKKARDLCALEVSCDCTVEMDRSLEALRQAFRDVERGCCVLLCEFNRGQIFVDSCYAVLEARFFEGVRYIASASLALKNVSGVPRSMGLALDPIQAMVTRLLRTPLLPSQTQGELGRLQSDLALFAALDNHARRALSVRMMETAERLSCCGGIEREAAHIIGALFAVQCRANQDAFIHRKEHRPGFHLHCPPEVRKVVVTDPVTRVTVEAAPANGAVFVPWEAGQSAQCTAFAEDGSLFDTTTLVSTI